MYWKYNGKIYSGTLVERHQVIGEVPMDEDGFQGRYKETNYWDWDIKGDDGRRYGIEEDRLTKDIRSIAN